MPDITRIWDVSRWSRARAVTAGLLIFASVSAADYLLRNEISVDVFYFLPIFLLTWGAGRRWGFAAAAGGVVVWLTDERIFALSFQEQHNIIIWNAVVRMLFFSTLAELVHRIKVLIVRERAVSKLKSDMIHTVSHEFNNALTGLSAGLFLLKEMDKDSSDGTRERVFLSMEGSQRKLALYVKNILNEARMEEGRFRIEKRPLALRGLAADAAGAVAELLAQKEIKLTTDAPETPVLVDADREAMALVISNLLGNAVKYTRRGGSIRIRIEPHGEGAARTVVFAVEDSGIGISLEDMEKITAGFYRAAEGRAEADGFGLGLRISNELLALHGSRLEIASEKGKGSRFYFELPAVAQGVDMAPRML